MANFKKETLQYWEEQARKVGNVSAVTHSDGFQRQMEIETISKYLARKDRVLDIGCGNGYGTAIFSKRCREITGIDFSPLMIKRARLENALGGKIHYQEGDIRTLRVKGSYSKVITVRCLINILSWNQQKKAIENIAGVLRKRGYYLMMEGIADGRAELNRVRVRLGLERLPVVKYNLDFQRKRTEAFLKKYFSIENFVTFGNYELVTRVIYPLYLAPQKPVYGSKFHEIAVRLCGTLSDFAPAIGKLGMWVLKKR